MNTETQANAMIEKLSQELRAGLMQLPLDGKLSAIGFFALIDGNAELAHKVAALLK
jgi:hypothetical protein